MGSPTGLTCRCPATVSTNERVELLLRYQTQVEDHEPATSDFSSAFGCQLIAVD